MRPLGGVVFGYLGDKVTVGMGDGGWGACLKKEEGKLLETQTPPLPPTHRQVVGRERALELSIIVMAFPTVILGCLPGYDSIGVLAPVLLTLIRMVRMGGGNQRHCDPHVRSSPSPLPTPHTGAGSSRGWPTRGQSGHSSGALS